MYNLDNGMFKISTKKISYISIIQTKPYKRQENVFSETGQKIANN